MSASTPPPPFRVSVPVSVPAAVMTYQLPRTSSQHHSELHQRITASFLIETLPQHAHRGRRHIFGRQPSVEDPALLQNHFDISQCCKLALIQNMQLFCSRILFLCLFLSLWPFQLILFHKFSRQLFASSLCSCCLIFALLILSTTFFFTKVFLNPDIILCG